jgi:hypothetical protein
LIKVASKSDIPFISADRMPGSDDFEATYIFPRKDGIILGGTAVANDARMEWDTNPRRSNPSHGAKNLFQS